MKVSRGLFLLLSCSPSGSGVSTHSCVSLWLQESQEKVLCEIPDSSQGDRAEPRARFLSLTTIPQASQMFGFGFQTLLLEDLGCLVAIKHPVVY